MIHADKRPARHEEATRRFSLFIWKKRKKKKKNNSTFCPHSCIYVFCVDLRTNGDYFPIQNWPTGFCNWDGVCLLRGTHWILSRYLVRIFCDLSTHHICQTRNTHTWQRTIPCRYCRSVPVSTETAPGHLTSWMHRYSNITRALDWHPQPHPHIVKNSSLHSIPIPPT
jgi:hypothetical protein